MKKVYIVIAILLLGAVSFFNFYHKKLTTQTSVYSGVFRVEITDNGFVPDNVTISQGTTVNFVNTGEKNHWPASNFHPTHTLYPEPSGCIGSKLDACKGLKMGEVFSFQFNKVGTWPMHDHLFPGLVMIIKVTNQAMSSLNFKSLDYGQELKTIKALAENDPAKAWSYLKENFVVNDRVIGNAHEFAHIVGNKAYAKFGLDGIKICDQTFAYGCFHGVTEAMLLKEGLKNVKSIEDQCLEEFPPSKSQGFTGCIHGTGHGIYTWEGSDVKKSLTDCDILTEGNRQYCYDGVFMENSENQKFEASDPWKFCSDLDKRYYLNCARYQSIVFFGTGGSKNSLQIVGQYCFKGPSDILKNTCYESLGFYVAQSSLGDSNEIWKDCQTMPDNNGLSLCTLGAAKETIFQKYGDWKTASNKLCQKLDDPYKKSCFQGLGK